ncbi:hypothetical protein BFS13_09965 [Pantoea sp. Ae16]|nr:hypothetical protein BFS13_09965 [Pantoea sp. Ae16]
MSDMRCRGFCLWQRIVQLNTGNLDDIIKNMIGRHCLACGEAIVDMSEADSFVRKASALEAAAAHNH